MGWQQPHQQPPQYQHPQQQVPQGQAPWLADRFLVRQRFTFMVNRYDIHLTGPDGRSPGPRVAFVQQKRLKLKEDISAWGDESRSWELFRLRAQKVLEIRGPYHVTAGDGTPLGSLRRSLRKSLFRTTWYIYDPAGNQIAWARERSLFVALWRRFADEIPVVGGLLALIPVPYHFDIFGGTGEHKIGEYRRLITLRDQYVLDLSGDPNRYLDRRLALAYAVAMDALQGR